MAVTAIDETMHAISIHCWPSLRLSQSKLNIHPNRLNPNPNEIVRADTKPATINESIWKDIHLNLKVLDLAKHNSLRLDALKGAAKFGQLDFLK